MIESASVIASRRLAVGETALLFCINDQNKAGAEAVAGTFISNFLKPPHANKAPSRLSTRLTEALGLSLEYQLQLGSFASKNPTKFGTLSAVMNRPAGRQMRPSAALPTWCVFAPTPYFQHSRLFGFRAIFAAVFASFFRRAVAHPMSTLTDCFCH